MPASKSAAPRLPTEIVSEIVQNALEGNSRWRNDIRMLCLVSQEFVNPCQAILFRRVAIRPPTGTTEAGEPRGTNLATRFSEVFENTPQLGKYVRNLSYKLASRVSDKTEAAKVLVYLTQLCTLRIEYEEMTNKDRYLDWAQSNLKWHRGIQKQSRALLEGFANLIASGTLRELVLKNIAVPADMIMRATIDTLRLEGSARLCPMTGKETPCDPVPIQHLKLTGDAAIYFGFALSSGNYPVSFSRLETLSILVAAERYALLAMRHILDKAVSLREFRLRTPDNKGINTHVDKLKDPIRHITSQAYTTLTSLVLDFTFNFTHKSDVIADPWHGLCRKDRSGMNTIGKLKALEYLKVVIRLEGVAWQTMNVDANFTHNNWKRLDESLLPGGPEGSFANPKLKRVEVAVAMSGDCVTAPKKIVDTIGAAIKTRGYGLPWLGSVMEKRKRGEVDAEIKTTVRHTPDCASLECPYKRKVAY